jgi:ketosteroid isomerase-like protein
MAERNSAVDQVEVVRRWMDLAPSGDWVTGLHDETQTARMAAFLEEFATPDIEIAAEASEGGGLISPASGAAGLLAFWQDWLEPWESFTLELEQVLDCPDAVLVEAMQRGRLRGSTAPVETPSAAVHFFRDGLLARIEFHLDRDRARRAAGLG